MCPLLGCLKKKKNHVRVQRIFLSIKNKMMMEMMRDLAFIKSSTKKNHTLFTSK